MITETEKSYAQVFAAERTTLAIKEVESGEGMPFILKATDKKVVIGKRKGRKYPHFRVPINVGEERLIGNLSLTVDTANSVDRTIHVTIRCLEGLPTILSLEDVAQKDDVLEFGSPRKVKIVLRKFRQDGRPLLHMAVAREIRVTSRERLSLH